MKNILLPLMILLVSAMIVFAGEAMAWRVGGDVEWSWNDETVGRSNFQHDFGVKKWADFWVEVENKAESYHLEQGANWTVFIVADGKTVGSGSGSVSPTNKYRQHISTNLDLDHISPATLSVNGYIYNTNVNTGRVWLTVDATYAE
jgi:hypothetical protein